MGIKRPLEEECPLFLSELPEGGVAAHSGLSALAAIIDDDASASEGKQDGQDMVGFQAPKKRRPVASLGEVQIALAFL